MLSEVAKCPARADLRNWSWAGESLANGSARLKIAEKTLGVFVEFQILKFHPRSLFQVGVAVVG